jgi:hypothetical protein
VGRASTAAVSWVLRWGAAPTAARLASAA